MSRPPLLAVAAAGVAAVAAVAGLRIVLTRQAAIARRRIGKPLGEQSIDADRVWRRSLDGAPIELLVLGDSLAAGLGAERRKETLGGRLAKGTARRMRRPVHLRTAAVVGAESPDLGAQLAALPEGYAPHVAVIVVGGNDVTHRLPVAVSTQHLRDAILTLRRRGVEVVVGTCPDLGALRPVPQPLRRLISSLSRRLAEAQAETARSAGAHPVDLRRAVGPMFFDDPEAMFSLDRFHPSPLGYRRTAEALLPAVCVAAEAALSSRRQTQPHKRATGDRGDGVAQRS
ncbi:SGNH/GDSL hydrolase family protein [Microbacterium sp. ISL-103]|uniref:SGNH/GDSL hydrolase family protein n=1 Tax=Microbacterium sp. ISL-103 TaxID=2819156 RepID=UPI001BECD50F|nr:SGNH/GDSL hydrolase family protein [Microbacterium sp. ISL-103]MBT2474107.1 SGNH/GDSL hydrolase family protein [Microbacterium sp. ISL-103]